jgi:hypothetical protein
MASENPLPHRSPSVGSVVKKALAINPDLNTPEIIALIRQATRVQGGEKNDFATAEVIDEEFALELARATLPKSALASPTL